MTAQPTNTTSSDAGSRGEEVDTLVIGAGQAGLATAWHLRRAGVPAVVVHDGAQVGEQWRTRYASLRLNTPARYDGLPGRPFPAPGSSFPTGREMGDHLAAYATEMGIDVRHRIRVTGVDRLDDGTFLVRAGTDTFHARHVVVATGSEHLPSTPPFAGELDPAIRQMHSSAYRDPGRLLPGPVLVVGAGQSGADLALETVRAGRETWLAGRPTGEIPINPDAGPARLALPVLWFAWNHVLTEKTPIGRRIKAKLRGGGAPLLRVKRADLTAAGVRHLPHKVTGAVDGRPQLDDGRVLDVANVIWCTGFRRDYSFIRPPVTGPDGWPSDRGGIVPDRPGLYFVGLTFQRGFYSMLIGGVGRDAAYVVRDIAKRRAARV